MKTFYMIYKDSNYPPTVKHASFKEAEKEAIRLSNKHPEEHFYVLQCVAIFIGRVLTEKIYTEHIDAS